LRRSIGFRLVESDIDSGRRSARRRERHCTVPVAEDADRDRARNEVLWDVL